MNLPGGWELLLIVAVIVLLFGAKRLPDASRSLGRSLRIFKAETKGLREDDDAAKAYDPRPHDARVYDRMVHPPQLDQQGQPLASQPPVPGVPPAPGSVAPPPQQP